MKDLTTDLIEKHPYLLRVRDLTTMEHDTWDAIENISGHTPEYLSIVGFYMGRNHEHQIAYFVQVLSDDGSYSNLWMIPEGAIASVKALS